MENSYNEVICIDDVDMKPLILNMELLMNNEVFSYISLLKWLCAYTGLIMQSKLYLQSEFQKKK